MNDIAEYIKHVSEGLSKLFNEPEMIAALAEVEKRNPGIVAELTGGKLIDEGEPVQENVVSDTPVAETPVAEVPVVTEAQEATTGGLVDEHPKKVKAHLAGKQRNIEIPSEVAKKIINNKPKGKLNINTEESNITVVPPVESVSSVEVVPPEPPQVEEPVIQSLPDDVVSTGDIAPIQETQKAKPEVQPLPGVDVSNEQNVNNQSVENTVNNDASSLSDVDVPTTAADMVNQSLDESKVASVESKGEEKTFVKSANDVATRV